MRIFLLFTFFIIFSKLNAQVKLGVQGGIGISKWLSTSASQDPYEPEYRTKELPGVQGGIVAEIRLSKKWMLRPGLILSEKGSGFNKTRSYDTSSEDIWTHYVGLPVTAMYQVYAHNKFSVRIGGGVYAAYCFSGVETGKGTSTGGAYFINSKVEFSNHNENDLFPIILRPFDFGYIINSSVQWKRFEILLSYDHGLYDLLPNSSLYNGNFRNRTISISVAYFVFE